MFRGRLRRRKRASIVSEHFAWRYACEGTNPPAEQRVACGRAAVVFARVMFALPSVAYLTIGLKLPLETYGARFSGYAEVG
jgi:hypothetical protein